MAFTRHDLLKASAAASALARVGLPVHDLHREAGAGPSARTVVVAGVVVETAPGAAPRVAARLLAERGLELQGGDGDRLLAAVFTGDARALEALAERLVREHPDVRGVFPTYVAEEPADSGATRDPPSTAPQPKENP